MSDRALNLKEELVYERLYIDNEIALLSLVKGLQYNTSGIIDLLESIYGNSIPELYTTQTNVFDLIEHVCDVLSRRNISLKSCT